MRYNAKKLDKMQVEFSYNCCCSTVLLIFYVLPMFYPCFANVCTALIRAKHSCLVVTHDTLARTIP